MIVESHLFGVVLDRLAGNGAGEDRHVELVAGFAVGCIGDVEAGLDAIEVVVVFHRGLEPGFQIVGGHHTVAVGIEFVEFVGIVDLHRNVAVVGDVGQTKARKQFTAVVTLVEAQAAEEQYAKYHEPEEKISVLAWSVPRRSGVFVVGILGHGGSTRFCGVRATGRLQTRWWAPQY